VRRQRCSLSELLGREFLSAWLETRALAPPPLLDVLDAKQASLEQAFPDTFAWGRGARRPKLREDLMGLLVVQVAQPVEKCWPTCLRAAPHLPPPHLPPWTL
jgi:hypothetical protein